MGVFLLLRVFLCLGVSVVYISVFALLVMGVLASIGGRLVFIVSLSFGFVFLCLVCVFIFCVLSIWCMRLGLFLICGLVLVFVCVFGWGFFGVLFWCVISLSIVFMFVGVVLLISWFGFFLFMVYVVFSIVDFVFVFGCGCVLCVSLVLFLRFFPSMLCLCGRYMTMYSFVFFPFEGLFCVLIIWCLFVVCFLFSFGFLLLVLCLCCGCLFL